MFDVSHRKNSLHAWLLIIINLILWIGLSNSSTLAQGSDTKTDPLSMPESATNDISAMVSIRDVQWQYDETQAIHSGLPTELPVLHSDGNDILELCTGMLTNDRAIVYDFAPDDGLVYLNHPHIWEEVVVEPCHGDDSAEVYLLGPDGQRWEPEILAVAERYQYLFDLPYNSLPGTYWLIIDGDDGYYTKAFWAEFSLTEPIINILDSESNERSSSYKEGYTLDARGRTLYTQYFGFPADTMLEVGLYQEDIGNRLTLLETWSVETNQFGVYSEDIPVDRDAPAGNYYLVACETEKCTASLNHLAMRYDSVRTPKIAWDWFSLSVLEELPVSQAPTQIPTTSLTAPRLPAQGQARPRISTPTPRSTNTATVTPTRTPTNSPMPTNTPLPTDTPTSTDTPTPLPTNTPTPTDTPTSTDTPTPLPTNTPLPTDTSTPTDTPTPLPTNTSLPTDTPTSTDTPSPTDTPTPLPTSTPLPTDTPPPTDTPTPLPTSTPLPTDTPTSTDTSPPTATSTNTSAPTATPTPLPTNTFIPTDTVVPTQASNRPLGGMALPAPVAVTMAFYNAIDAGIKSGDFSEAYNYLSQIRRARQSYAEFASSFTTTIAVEIESLEQLEFDSSTASVNAVIVATDRMQNGTQKAKYDIVYQVVKAEDGWKMNEAKISRLSAEVIPAAPVSDASMATETPEYTETFTVTSIATLVVTLPPTSTFTATPAPTATKPTATKPTATKPTATKPTEPKPTATEVAATFTATSTAISTVTAADTNAGLSIGSLARLDPIGASDGVNIRSEPGIENDIEGGIPANGLVTILSEPTYVGGTPWHMIQFVAISGWVSGEYLIPFAERARDYYNLHWVPDCEPDRPEVEFLELGQINCSDTASALDMDELDTALRSVGLLKEGENIQPRTLGERVNIGIVIGSESTPREGWIRIGGGKPGGIWRTDYSGSIPQVGSRCWLRIDETWRCE